MEWNLFIVPLTAIFVQLLKSTELNKKWYPVIAVLFGGILGVVYGLYYHQEILTHVVNGIIYGASASGIYDLVVSHKPEATNDIR